MSPNVESVARTDAGLASELRVSVMRLRRRLLNERASDDLSLRALAVLGVLYRNGEATIGQLADHERVKPPSMTRTVAWLSEAGYVCRRSDVDDRRVVLVDLTDQGRDSVLADRRRRDAWRRTDRRGRDQRQGRRDGSQDRDCHLRQQELVRRLGSRLPARGLRGQSQRCYRQLH